MLLIVTVAVPPPGSRQTATASRIRMPKLRSSLLRSGPMSTTIACPRGRRPRSGADRRGHVEGGKLLDCDGRRSGRDGVRGLGREPVADPEVGVDVAPARRRPLQLLPQLA